MKTYKYGIDFFSEGGALTLHNSQIADDKSNPGYYVKKHPSGWTIGGCLVEDCFTWVNVFVAHHPTLGYVSGDFEREVWADSEEAFEHFYKHHTPISWDYGDI